MPVVVFVVQGGPLRPGREGLAQVLHAVQSAAAPDADSPPRGLDRVELYLLVSGPHWQHGGRGAQIRWPRRRHPGLRIVVNVPDDITAYGAARAYLWATLDAVADDLERRGRGRAAGRFAGAATEIRSLRPGGAPPGPAEGH
jgi:hypothetical protein